MPITRLVDYREMIENIQMDIVKAINRESKQLNAPILDSIEATKIRATKAGLEEAQRIMAMHINEANKSSEFHEKRIGQSRTIVPNEKP